MNDSPARGHPVYRPGFDPLHATEAVPVHDLSFEQVRERGNTNMRVRPDVDTGSWLELCGSDMVEENERSDHLPPARG
jgi:hypothetical protein